MIGSRRVSSLIRATLFAGSSIVTLGVAASPAIAQCAPDPTIADGTTTCTGIDPNGLNVPTAGTRVIVQAGATVNSVGFSDNIVTSGGTSTLTIAGAVNSYVTPGIKVTTADAYYGYLGPCDPYAGAAPVACGSP